MKSSWFTRPPFSASPAFVPKYSASCFCKRVRFEVATDPVRAKLCDCSVCMRLHGAPMQWAALFHKDAVRFDPSSADFLRFYSPEEDAAYENGEDRCLPCKIQCKHCGTWVADEGKNMSMAFPRFLSS